MDDFSQETIKLAEQVERHASKAIHDDVKRMLHDAAEAIKAAGKKHRTLQQ